VDEAKLTVRLRDARLYGLLKLLAAQRGISMNRLVEEALARELQLEAARAVPFSATSSTSFDANSNPGDDTSRRHRCGRASPYRSTRGRARSRRSLRYAAGGVLRRKPPRALPARCVTPAHLPAASVMTDWTQWMLSRVLSRAARLDRDRSVLYSYVDVV